MQPPFQKLPPVLLPHLRSDVPYGQSQGAHPSQRGHALHCSGLVPCLPGPEESELLKAKAVSFSAPLLLPNTMSGTGGPWLVTAGRQEAHRLWSLTAWLHILVPLLMRCVTLSKVRKLSELHFGCRHGKGNI